jgi:uroporphyrinogen-III synthase
MPIRALITRPVEDAATVASALTAREVEVAVEPLLAVRVLQGTEVPLDGVQAVLFTSANGVRAYAALSPRRDLPALCVGDATAAAAQAAGFTSVRSAGGDVRELAVLARETLKPEDGALLHAAGTAVAGDLAQLLGADGFTVRRVELYEAVPIEALSPATLKAIAAAEFDMVLLFSPRTAATFVKLLHAAEEADGVSPASLIVGCARMLALCLSPGVAQAASEITWAAVRVAARPDLPSMLALVDGAVAEIKGDVGRRGGTTQPSEAERAISRSGAQLPPATTAPHPRPDDAAARREPAPEPEPIVAPRPGAARRDRGRAGAVWASAAAALVVTLLLVLTQGWWLPAVGVVPWAPETPGQEVLIAERIALAEERLDEAVGTVQALDQQVAAVRQQLDAFNDLMGGLQTEVTGLQQGAAAGGGTLPPAIAGLPDQVAALDRRLEALAAGAPAPSGGDAAVARAATETALADARAEMNAVRDELLARLAELRTAMASEDVEARAADEARQAVATRLDALDERLGALDRIVGGRRSEVAGAALVLAIGQLRAVLESARPFAGELTTLEQVAAGAPPLAAGIAPLVAPLRDLAAEGVPTLMQLRDRFPATASAVMEAANREAVSETVGAPPEGWMEDVVDSVSGLVTVRPVGDVEGDGPGARVARAEARLAEGALAAAVSELAGLEGGPAEAAAGWLAQARARLVAQGALDELQRTALDQLSAMAAAEPGAPPAEQPEPAAADAPAEGSTPQGATTPEPATTTPPPGG